MVNIKRFLSSQNFCDADGFTGSKASELGTRRIRGGPDPCGFSLLSRYSIRSLEKDVWLSHQSISTLYLSRRTILLVFLRFIKVSHVHKLLYLVPRSGQKKFEKKRMICCLSYCLGSITVDGPSPVLAK